MLVQYDIKKLLVLICKFSLHGVGAVLSHLQNDRHEALIAYYS